MCTVEGLQAFKNTLMVEKLIPIELSTFF